MSEGQSASQPTTWLSRKVQGWTLFGIFVSGFARSMPYSLIESMDDRLGISFPPFFSLRGASNKKIQRVKWACSIRRFGDLASAPIDT